MLMSHTLYMVFTGLPNFNIPFIHTTSLISFEFTRTFGCFCITSTYFFKINNGFDYFVGSPVVMRPDKDKHKQ